MRIYPVLRFGDAAAAITWLEAALGFETHARHEGEDGSIAHAQLQWGEQLIMLGEASQDPYGSTTGVANVYLSCPDPDAVFERATRVGADVLYPPRDTEYGSREAGVRDPEGNAWSFGTYEPR